MKIAKRLISVALAAIIIIGAFTEPVLAESIYDTAVALPSGKKQSFTLAAYKEKDYKITLSQKGTLTLNINAFLYRANLYLYDANGNPITCSEYNFTSGRGNIYNSCLECYWNEATEDF